MTRSPSKVFLYMLAAAIFVAVLSMAATSNAGGLDDALQLTKQQRGAYLGLEFRWGGDGPVQKFLHIRGVVPRAGGVPFTAATGTRIQFNAVSDLNPFGWSPRNQLLAVVGLGVAYWAITAEHRHSHKRHHAALASPPPGDDGENDGDSGDNGEGDSDDGGDDGDSDGDDGGDDGDSGDNGGDDGGDSDDDSDDDDDDSDSDSDGGRRDHCTDGRGRDGEKNKHC